MDKKFLLIIFIIIIAAVASYKLSKTSQIIEEENLSKLQNIKDEDLKKIHDNEKNTEAQNATELPSTNDSSKHNKPDSDSSKAVTENKNSVDDFTNKKELSETEINSIKAMAATMAEASNTNHKPQTLIKNLSEAGLAPLMGKDFNEDTGKMLIVRTQNTIPGIRYIHAQYFEDENKHPFLQHLSFEIRGGKNAMNEAIKAVKEMKKELSKPTIEKNYIEWQTKDGYVIEVNTITKEMLAELKHDPHNAYSKDDVGVVQVTIEQEVH